ncbi:MAG TPA: XdhC family protein [Anseongella sp.]|nr:XdhC family protein [Anseongella sp.]
MKELKQIIHAFELACKKQQRTALATVVHVAGSSYRGPGARMLIREDGMLTGAISGGCLEGDALRKALMVMMQGKPLLATYDTSDENDALMGAALGCKGVIRVLIEPLGENEARPITFLKAALQKRQPAVLVTFYDLEDKWNLQQGTRLFMGGDGSRMTGGEMPAAISAVVKDGENAFEKKTSLFVKYPRSGGAGPKEQIAAFIGYLPPTISLVVAGAGNDVLPLAQLSKVLGWDITLVDGRPHYASAQRFPDCRLIVSDPAKALQGLVTDDRTAAVLMTHNYNYDKSVLRALLARSLPYIGMLGPKKKLNRMLAELQEEGTVFSAEQLSRIHSPVGLDIGAETAEEIALAILSEIKAVFAGKGGAYLRDAPGNIHGRPAGIREPSAFSGG